MAIKIIEPPRALSLMAFPKSVCSLLKLACMNEVLPYPCCLQKIVVADEDVAERSHAQCHCDIPCLLPLIFLLRTIMPRKTKSTQSPNSPDKYKQRTLLESFSSSPPAPARNANRRNPKPGRATQKQIHSSDSEASRSPAPKRHSRKHRRATSPVVEDSDSSDVGKIRFEAQSSSSETESDTRGQSSSEEEIESLSPKRPVKRQRILNSESDQSDLDCKRTRLRSSRRDVKRDTAIEIRSDSESEPEQRARGRLVKGHRAASNNHDEDILSGIDEDSKSAQKSPFASLIELPNDGRNRG